MKIKYFPDEISLDSIRIASEQTSEVVVGRVKEILNCVKSEGDAAVREFTERFDKQQIESLLVSKDSLKAGAAKVSSEVKSAIKMAMENITRFHEKQRPGEFEIETQPGVRCGQFYRPIERVGLYVPGGTAPLFSTVLMLAVPARLAGCSEISICTPPQKNGEIDPAVCYCAQMLGIESVFRVGGAQAIGAMAYGTESIKKVDKIFGPGNLYVNEAKKIVSQEGIAIDLPAGPSEMLIIADDSANPEFVAADLLAQAEHDPSSVVILVALSEKFASRVNEELDKQLTVLPRRSIAQQALDKSVIILVGSIEEAVSVSNTFAPEHLSLQCRDAASILSQIQNAGSVFVGEYSAEALGDYISGTNHTLPTAGATRAYSGITLASFLKATSWQEVSKIGLKNIGSGAVVLAEAEHLVGHARSVSIRMEEGK